MTRILAVEDDADILDLLLTYLSRAGYDASGARDAEAALSSMKAAPPDLILLDVLLPGADGFTLCEVIRRRSRVPILMLTALDDEKSQLRGFDLGVDDYIPKPFSMPVLLAKIEAVLRRSGMGGHRRLSCGALALDLEAHEASIGGRPVALTLREFELLRVLLLNRGIVLSRQTLLNRVWSYDFLGDERIVDTHIKNLRRKLGLDLIETIRGVGYRIA